MINMSQKLDSLMKELKISNSETYFHMIRVKNLVINLIDITNSMGVTNYTQDDISAICKGALLHDIGKLYVKNVILTKDNSLSDEEKRVMREHAQTGIDSIEEELDCSEHDIVVNICKYHHERIDGSGYFGLKDVPFYVQIVSICDVFDALSTDRIYREGLGFEGSMELIKNGDCGKFDEFLIECLYKVIDY